MNRDSGTGKEEDGLRSREPPLLFMGLVQVLDFNTATKPQPCTSAEVEQRLARSRHSAPEFRLLVVGARVSISDWLIETTSQNKYSAYQLTLTNHVYKRRAWPRHSPLSSGLACVPHKRITVGFETKQHTASLFP